MVKEIKHKGKKYFQYEICKIYYKTFELAQKCEDFCKKHNACSIDIIKHAVNLNQNAK